MDVYSLLVLFASNVILKITADLRELLFMQIISIDIYHIRLKPRNVNLLINSLKDRNSKLLKC